MPADAETRNLVNAERLAMMKPSAYLINTSRGPLVDERALADALRAGQIAGAGLDVLSIEPPPADHPLLTAPNCCITPHIAWATRAARSPAARHDGAEHPSVSRRQAAKRGESVERISIRSMRCTRHRRASEGLATTPFRRLGEARRFSCAVQDETPMLVVDSSMGATAGMRPARFASRRTPSEPVNLIRERFRNLTGNSIVQYNHRSGRLDCQL